MKKRLLYLVVIFVGFLALFALEKPLFILFQSRELLADITFGDWLRVIWHGLKLDISVASSLLIFPWITVFVSVWVTGYKWPGVANRIYFIFVSLFLSLVFVGNMVLYGYWGFPLDCTPLFYLKNPGYAMAGAPRWFVVAGLLFIIVLWLLLNRGLGCCTRKLLTDMRPAINRGWWSVVMVIMGGVLCLGIRGGAGPAVHAGDACFSDNTFLNHAAVNPAFSLLESFSKERRAAKYYRYFSEEERKTIFDALKAPAADSIPKMLTTERPDVILVLLESFTMNIMAETVDSVEVTPRINALRHEGIWFTDFYANSFRTDRGLTAVLNGYPAQPNTSIMKHTAKSGTLPSIAKSLQNKGYSTQMLYGGDIDFANMRSYFQASGYTAVTGSDGLSLNSDKSDWGYDDGAMFGELLRRTGAKPEGERFFTTFLTLSSHEPFRVPFERFSDPVLNSMAYTDDCLGRFIDELKATRQWDNLLVILVADHAYAYPHGLKNSDPQRHHIPMLWTGGAVARPLTVEGSWSQTDIAATLLSQMGTDESEFVFSRNIFNPLQQPLAFYAFNNGFGLIDPSGTTVWDCNSERALILRGEQGASGRERKGKAILQTLMEDMDRR